jgi:acetoin utilization deacetylase AcuC-like enzyme
MQRLVYFYNQGHEAHYEAGHPERPERVEAIVDALKENNYWEAHAKLPGVDIPRDLLTRIHTREYLEILEATCRKGAHYDADTYTTPASWELAHSAAGGAAAVASAV